MSYPTTWQVDTLYRKEFYALRWQVPNYREGEYDPVLKINSHQLFAAAIMNPDTPYQRMHLLHHTGTGKTLAALAIAHKFAQSYRKIYNIQAVKYAPRVPDSATPTIYVMGFAGTKAAFYRDLLKYPDFGFITGAEKEELAARQKIAESGLPDDIKYLKEFQSMLRRRITNKQRGGFFKFYGYDEFVNRLFITDLKLTDIELAVVQHNRTHPDALKTLEETFNELMRAGKITVNTELVASFENSLIICDEIHNTYNMYARNNRGVALQYILDTVPTVRFLSLSATPINSSPTEVIDWMNYLVPRTARHEIFSGRHILANGIETLKRKLAGKISFLQDISVKYFPSREFVGEEIRIPHRIGDFDAGARLPYLVFRPCPMSEFHQATLTHYLNTRQELIQPDDASTLPREDRMDDEHTNPDINTRSLPTDGFSLYDIAFPQPNASVGMFRSMETRTKLTSASSSWRSEHGIFMRQHLNMPDTITGAVLRAETIRKYSTKYATVLQCLDEIFATLQNNDDPKRGQKVMLYHDRVRMSGVLLLQELLLANGFADEFSSPTDATRCATCGKVLLDHPKTHPFRPARFVIVHSDVEKPIMDASLHKFNGVDNTHGQSFMVLIGSKIIRESYDFKSIQHLIMVSLPVNMPTFIQVLGRCIRKHSHALLPPDQRRVRVHVLCSVVNKAFPYVDEASPEIYRYVDKLSDYLVIQRIEKALAESAIDADMHRDIIMPPTLLEQYFPDGQNNPPKQNLGALYFEPDYTLQPRELSTLPLDTFTSNRYGEEEIKLAVQLIKRLFMKSPVWEYESLLANVRAPPIGLETNPRMILEHTFVCALAHMVGRKQTIVAAKPLNSTLDATMLDRLLDYNDRFVYPNGCKSQIENIGKYYILFPVQTVAANPLNEIPEQLKDREKVQRIVPQPEHVNIDVEMYLRQRAPQPPRVVNIDSFLAKLSGQAYTTQRKKFMARDTLTTMEYVSGTNANFQQQILEESIALTLQGKALPMHTRVIECARELGAIITMKEVQPYKAVIALFKTPPNYKPNTAIGYTAATCKLYDPSGWITVSRVSLNRQVQYKENEIIIGLFETVDGATKFKIRKPSQSLKPGITDTRLVERGVVCSSMGKTPLFAIAAKLGLRTGENTIKNVCDQIQENLLKSEIRERAKESRYKYVYGWW